MNDNKLKVKDFITIGIFTALIFVVEFACGIPTTEAHIHIRSQAFTLHQRFKTLSQTQSE